mgnify:CR=1 FL=1
MTTRAETKMNQSEFLAIFCNLLKARERLRVVGKRSNCEIPFDSHLKAVLCAKVKISYMLLKVFLPLCRLFETLLYIIFSIAVAGSLATRCAERNKLLQKS